jgi:hypothetical protein
MFIEGVTTEYKMGGRTERYLLFRQERRRAGSESEGYSESRNYRMFPFYVPLSVEISSAKFRMNER